MLPIHSLTSSFPSAPLAPLGTVPVAVPPTAVAQLPANHFTSTNPGSVEITSNNLSALSRAIEIRAWELQGHQSSSLGSMANTFFLPQVRVRADEQPQAKYQAPATPSPSTSPPGSPASPSAGLYRPFSPDSTSSLTSSSSPLSSPDAFFSSPRADSPSAAALMVPFSEEQLASQWDMVGFSLSPASPSLLVYPMVSLLAFPLSFSNR